MKTKLTLQKRLVLPIVLLGLVTLLSNVLAVFSINNVHANAGTIVDQYMVSEARLEEIRRSMMDIHRLALSHIVAADHATMIRLVQEIKAEEAGLDERLASYREFVGEKDLGTYQSLLENYDSFKHSLVYLVCASADSKTQDAYAVANGDVALWSSAAEQDLDALYASVSSQAEAAQERLFAVYLSALVTSAVTLLLGVLLVAAAFRIVRRYVIAPIRDAMGMLQGSSQRIVKLNPHMNIFFGSFQHNPVPFPVLRPINQTYLLLPCVPADFLSVLIHYFQCQYCHINHPFLYFISYSNYTSEI